MSLMHFLVSAFQLAFHIYKEEEPAISGRIEPSEPTFGSNFAKQLPVQEAEMEIQPNSRPSCWVLSQLPLCYPLSAGTSCAGSTFT
jgi:hypothetical protein